MRAHRTSPTIERPSRARPPIAGFGLIALLLCTTAAATAAAQPKQAGLAAGPYSVLQGVLKKTVFRVEVARVQIRVDRETQHDLAELTEGRKRTRALSEGAVRTVLGTKQALITAELRRNVPFDRYVESAYKDLADARKSGLVSQDSYWMIARLLPEWFRAFEDRGARKGDRFLCRLTPTSMRVVYTTASGRKLIDRTVRGRDPGRAVLASYLAPGSNFRDELIDSLFR